MRRGDGGVARRGGERIRGVSARWERAGRPREAPARAGAQDRRRAGPPEASRCGRIRVRSRARRPSSSPPRVRRPSRSAPKARAPHPRALRGPTASVSGGASDPPDAGRCTRPRARLTAAGEEALQGTRGRGLVQVRDGVQRGDGDEVAGEPERRERHVVGGDPGGDRGDEGEDESAAHPAFGAESERKARRVWCVLGWAGECAHVVAARRRRCRRQRRGFACAT